MSEKLNITKVKSFSDLYSKPLGTTVVTMTDRYAHTRPVLFDGPVLGGKHFLEARQRKGRLEIVSRVIPLRKLGHTYEEEGFFNHSEGPEFIYSPDKSLDYELLLKKVNAVGLIKWAQEHPYRERRETESYGYGGDSEAE